jgi:hypothetical protein
VSAAPAHAAGIGHVQGLVGAPADDAAGHGQRATAGGELGDQPADRRRRAEGQRGRVHGQCGGQAAQRSPPVGHDRVDRVGDHPARQPHPGRRDVLDHRVAAALGAVPPGGTLRPMPASPGDGGRGHDPASGLILARRGRGRSVGAVVVARLAATVGVSSIRSPGWQSRMSHNAASVAQVQPLRHPGHQPVDLLPGQLHAALCQRGEQVRGREHAPLGHPGP